ncbi:MAG: ATP-binding protein [Actinobacteria bacterium]|nr:ATP-binding protein [Actinomycetota bacterium]
MAEPMRPIPVNFGQPDLTHVVGREPLLDEIRSYLEHGTSVLLTGERRIGKSWIAWSLEAAPPPGWVTVYVDVEHLSTVDQFVRVVCERIIERLPMVQQLVDRLRQAGASDVKGLPLPLPPQEAGERLHWLIRQITEEGHRLILLLDELPILAQTLAQNERSSALLLLRTLRALRAEERGLRLVCLGSIGFHHTLADDAESKATAGDLHVIRVGPLHQEAAVMLARRLLAGIGAPSPPGDPVAEAIAAASDHIPFYEHKLVAGLDLRRRSGLPLDVDAVWSTRQAALAAGDDPWRMDHYQDRLKEYFASEARLAHGILDAIAVAGDGGIGFADLVDRVAADENVARSEIPVNRDRVRSVLRRLQLDHYVDSTGDGTFRFCFAVVHDAWVVRRFLAPQ